MSAALVACPLGKRGRDQPVRSSLEDVAGLGSGPLSLGGRGLSGGLPRTHVPNSKLNAAIAGFQRLNNLTPDGLVNPHGPAAGDGGGMASRAPVLVGGHDAGRGQRSFPWLRVGVSG